MSNTPASESKAVAQSVQPDAPKVGADFTVAEVREDGTVIVAMEDGRMFPAEAPEGVEVKKGNVVVLKSPEFDKHDVPKDAKIARVK